MFNRFIKIIVITLFLITIIRILDLYYIKHEEYYLKYLDKTNTLVKGFPKARGKILDSKGVVLVDNKGINNIVYRDLNQDELEIAYKLSEILIINDTIDDVKIKEFYLKNNNTDYLITEEEHDLYKNRKLTNEEIKQLKLERLNNEISSYTPNDINAIKIYYLMQNGYSYDNKIIKENISDKECARVSELNISGVTCEVSWQRLYNYDSLNSIYGTIGSIPSENIKEYLDNGYSINDTVGISYLEKEYEDYLKGTKDLYQVNNDNTLTLIKEGKRGNDLYLSIDIELQEKVEEILKRNIENGKKLKNTEYYDRSFALVSNPNTGAIIAAAGFKYKDGNFIDITNEIATSSFIVGSVVKGASITVGYQNNLIEVGKKINDSCVKLNNVPEKCSYKRWGMLDDVTALKTSSNYYQFILAIKLTGQTYKSNMTLNATKEHFDTYRDTFASFGLGTETGIDLPYEAIGIKGKTIADDLLLNLAIGQYDTYTPLQLIQYINTVAMNGNRIKLSLMEKITDDNDVVLQNEGKLLNQVSNNRFDRIKEGMRQVIDGGTGRGYADVSTKAAGKTGTAEVVYGKGINTINQTFASFAPYDNPKYSIVVISPNAYYDNSNSDTVAPINYHISKELTALVYGSNSDENKE